MYPREGKWGKPIAAINEGSGSKTNEDQAVLIDYLARDIQLG